LVKIQIDKGESVSNQIYEWFQNGSGSIGFFPN
jgi:hypothetical protein